MPSHFVHQVTFIWSNITPSGHVEQVMAELRKLSERVAHVYYAFGSDHGLRMGNADFGIIGVFEDQAGYEAYANDEFHLRFIERYITPYVDQRAAVQYAVVAGENPAALMHATEPDSQ